MSYIVEIIHYVAWPLVVLVIFFLIRNPFKLLISGIEELVIRYKDLQASAKVKPKDVKKLPALKVQTEAIAPSPPPDYKEAVEPIILLKDARKVLATLYDGQLRHFGEEGISKGQWSFRVLPHSPIYGNFTVGFAQLLGLGLAGWEQKNGQAVLTQKGFEYAKEHPEIRDSEDIYRF
jgi:hypothetical protein